MRVALVGNDEQLLRFAELAASGGAFLPSMPPNVLTSSRVC